MVVTLPTRADWVREATGRGATVLIGDARDPQMLIDAGIATSRAVIAVTDQDAVNIGVALDAKRLCPGVPVVVRLFDQGLAGQVESSFDIRRALSMSAVAAPAFASAAMGDQLLGSFAIDGVPHVIARLPVESGDGVDGKTIQELATGRHLAPVALDRPGDAWTLVPDIYCTLRPDDVVSVLTRSSASDESSGPPLETHHTARKSALGSVVAHSRRILDPGNALHLWAAAPLGLRIVLSALVLFIALSVLVFNLGMGLSFVDALYYVTATITTTGYGDITPRDATDALKLYAIAMMLLGSVLFAALYSAITDLLIRTRFEQLLGREQMPAEDHVVVAGLGNLGYRVMEELRRSGTSAVAIERNADAEFVAALRQHGPAVIGDARLVNTLLKAGVATATCLVAATGDDAANLAISLSAKELNGELRTIVRLFDSDLAQKVRGTLSVDAVMSASLIAAPAFVGAALHAGALHAFEAAGCLVVLLRRTAGPELVGVRPSTVRQDLCVVTRRRGNVGAFEVGFDDLPLEAGEEFIAIVSHPLID